MTTATIAGKRQTLTIEQKAALLQVVDVHEPGLLAVVSGSDNRIAYAVYHANGRVTSCACTGCKVYGHTHCAYRVAAQRELNKQAHLRYRDLFPGDFFDIA